MKLLSLKYVVIFSQRRHGIKVAFEIYYIQIPFGEVASKTLTFSIYDFDRFSKHDQIGQVLIPLHSIDLGQVVEQWKDITPPPDDKETVRQPVYLLHSVLQL